MLIQENVAHWVDWWLKDGMAHACYMSLQIYCIIMQWHLCLGYHLKQKTYRINSSQMQGGDKYYNMVGIPICHFNKGIRMESHDCWAPIRLKLMQTMDKGQVDASFVPFQWRTIYIGLLNAQLIISFGIWTVHTYELQINYNMPFVSCNKVSNISTFHLPKW